MIGNTSWKKSAWVIRMMVGILGLRTGFPESQFATRLEQGHGYLLSTPALPAGPRGAPLLVCLHGTDERPDKAMEIFGKPATEAGFIVLCPAPVGRNWSIEDDPPRILSLVHVLTQSHPVDTGRIFVTGFSSGATLAFILGTMGAETFNAAALASGHYTSVISTLPGNGKRLPFRIIHGKKDPVFPYAESKQSAKLLSQKGYEVEFVGVNGLAHDYPPSSLIQSLLEWFLRQERKEALPRGHQP